MIRMGHRDSLRMCSFLRADVSMISLLHSYRLTHLLTAEPLWHGAELWWGVLQFAHRHIHVAFIILSLPCKIRHNQYPQIERDACSAS